MFSKTTKTFYRSLRALRLLLSDEFVPPSSESSTALRMTHGVGLAGTQIISDSRGRLSLQAIHNTKITHHGSVVRYYNFVSSSLVLTGQKYSRLGCVRSGAHPILLIFSSLQVGFIVHRTRLLAKQERTEKIGTETNYATLTRRNFFFWQ